VPYNSAVFTLVAVVISKTVILPENWYLERNVYRGFLYGD
jgi:hypothetical protein